MLDAEVESSRAELLKKFRKEQLSPLFCYIITAVSFFQISNCIMFDGNVHSIKLKLHIGQVFFSYQT